jgi:hypothetical protein
MFMSANTHEPSADRLALCEGRGRENSDLSMFMSANIHEPSADTDGATAQSWRTVDLSEQIP